MLIGVLKCSTAGQRCKYWVRCLALKLDLEIVKTLFHKLQAIEIAIISYNEPLLCQITASPITVLSGNSGHST